MIEPGFPALQTDSLAPKPPEQSRFSLRLNSKGECHETARECWVVPVSCLTAAEGKSRRP